MTLKNTLLFLCFVCGLNSQAQNLDSLLATQYFDNGLTPLDTAGFSFSQTHTASPSFWAIDSFPESVVFQTQLTYSNPLDSNESYQIRIGKGGHLYSFRSSFGESVPPQWRPQNWTQPTYGGGTSYAPWVDEVWQMVCVDGNLNNPPDSSYFIHQSGVYLKTPEQSQPFYSPIVAEYYDENHRSYKVVNWGQQAHTEDLLNTGFTSSLLYYSSYTNLGKGVLQVDNMIYNFGNDNISFLNIPWGGVRNSSLDHFFISDQSNNYTNSPGLYGQTPVVQTASTGGWMAWANDSLGNSQSLGMAHPVGTNTNGNVFRYGDAGNLSTNQRDYNVFEMIRFPAPGQLGFGQAMCFRYFYVLGSNVDSVKSSIIQNGLVDAAMDSAYTPLATEVDSVRYRFEQNGSNISASIINSGAGLMLRTSPYLNSYPLFLISSDSVQALSSNPYYFSSMAYDEATANLQLLGFLDNPSQISIAHDTICVGESYTFPDSTFAQNLQSDTTHVSTFASSQIGWDSLVFSNVHVHEIDLGVTDQFTQLVSNQENALYQWLDCVDSMEPVPGAINQIYEAEYNGEFAVELTVAGCIDTSACIYFHPIGVSELTLNEDFQLHPNPTMDMVVIEFESVQENLKISVFSTDGRLIYQDQLINSGRIEILSGQKPGIYLIEISDPSGRKSTVRVIKN